MCYQASRFLTSLRSDVIATIEGCKARNLKMKILITGVNGFIGRHVSRNVAATHTIFGVTRAGSPIPSQPAVKLLQADLSEPHFCNCLPLNTDCVIHLAQSQHYRTFPEGADDMRRINIDATFQLLEWARKADVKQFIFASTANVYGKSKDLLTESSPTQPESFYGASKLAAEHLVQQYKKFFQVDILRLFTVYGPGQKGMLIPNLIERIKTGQRITLAEGVGLYLTPIYVGDVVATIDKLIETPSKIPVRLFNVCGNKVVSLAEIVKTIEALMGLQAVIELTDEKVQYFTGAQEALRKCLVSIDFTDIERGLELTVDSASELHQAVI